MSIKHEIIFTAVEELTVDDYGRYIVLRQSENSITIPREYYKFFMEIMSSLENGD